MVTGPQCQSKSFPRRRVCDSLVVHSHPVAAVTIVTSRNHSTVTRLGLWHALNSICNHVTIEKHHRLMRRRVTTCSIRARAFRTISQWLHGYTFTLSHWDGVKPLPSCGYILVTVVTGVGTGVPS
jgi:hypothetical protein